MKLCGPLVGWRAVLYELFHNYIISYWSYMQIVYIHVIEAHQAFFFFLMNK